MNIARTFIKASHPNVGKTFVRTFRCSAANLESSRVSQPQVQEEKFDFEDLKVIERVERRKAKIEPFMKNVFVSLFDRELLAYPEILNKEEDEAMERRVSALNSVFSDPNTSKEDRINMVKRTSMYAAPIQLTLNGLASNCTENLRYLEAISSDIELAQEISDHWVALEALKHGLTEEQLRQIIDDLITGDRTVTLCIKERISERVQQADFRTKAELDSQGVWRITGEKVCQHDSGYYLVVASYQSELIKAFLVHPGAQGISYKKPYCSFRDTPATPLESLSDTTLARTLGLSRIHAATMSRSVLKQATKNCLDYVHPRFLSGKPLSELPTIRKVVGEAILTAYASESADFFTAGLIDGYMDPDAEMEMAMCRNFMAEQGLGALLKLVSIPALDENERGTKLIEDIRHLSMRGETIDSVNMFIAMNGIQHAGKNMATEIKQMRNPLLFPAFIIQKMFTNYKQEKDDPKLTLQLSEHLHPSLRNPAELLEYCVLRMRYACETLMARHGIKIIEAHTELNRLASAGTDILAMSAVLARASRSYCTGIKDAEVEMKLATCFVIETRDRVKRLIKEIDDGHYVNLDDFKLRLGEKVFSSTSTQIYESATSRNIW